MIFYFFFYSYASHLYLHSFPTRRSSDLSLVPVNRERLIGDRHPEIEGQPGCEVPAQTILRQRWHRRHNSSSFPIFPRSEEHTSELQSRPHLVCRLLLEKKKLIIYNIE